jgi:segregation and condensation protein B
MQELEPFELDQPEAAEAGPEETAPTPEVNTVSEPQIAGPTEEAADLEGSTADPARDPARDAGEATGATDAPLQPETHTIDPAVEAAAIHVDAITHPEASLDDLLSLAEEEPEVAPEDLQLRAVLEAIVYVAEEPLTLAQLAAVLQQPPERIRKLIGQLIEDLEGPEHGITIREVAGGYKMATKPEHHDAVRSFVKSLKPPLKLSLPALETLAVIAYKQPVTAPEIMDVRGVQGAGVLKTLLDRKLIAVAGRKNVIGKPILYKTTKEFLIQFGLKDLTELPSLKEFEEIRRMALADDVPPPAEAPPDDSRPDSPENSAEPPASAADEAPQVHADGSSNAAEAASEPEPASTEK